jgi:hypothetical protein
MQPLQLHYMFSNMAQKSTNNNPVTCLFAISQMHNNLLAFANTQLQGIVKTNNILHSYRNEHMFCTEAKNQQGLSMITSLQLHVAVTTSLRFKKQNQNLFVQNTLYI